LRCAALLQPCGQGGLTGSTEVGKLSSSGGHCERSRSNRRQVAQHRARSTDLDVAIPGAASASSSITVGALRAHVYSCGRATIALETSAAPRALRLVGAEPAGEMGPWCQDPVDRSRVSASGRRRARTVCNGERHGETGFSSSPRPRCTTKKMRVWRKYLAGGDSDALQGSRRRPDSPPTIRCTAWPRACGRTISSRSHANELQAGRSGFCYNIFDAALPFGGISSRAGAARWAVRFSRTILRRRRSA
jgi:hypothetical protein